MTLRVLPSLAMILQSGSEEEKTFLFNHPALVPSRWGPHPHPLC